MANGDDIPPVRKRQRPGRADARRAAYSIATGETQARDINEMMGDEDIDLFVRQGKVRSKDVAELLRDASKEQKYEFMARVARYKNKQQRREIREKAWFEDRRDELAPEGIAASQEHPTSYDPLDHAERQSNHARTELNGLINQRPRSVKGKRSSVKELATGKIVVFTYPLSPSELNDKVAQIIQSRLTGESPFSGTPNIQLIPDPKQLGEFNHYLHKSYFAQTADEREAAADAARAAAGRISQVALERGRKIADQKFVAEHMHELTPTSFDIRQERLESFLRGPWAPKESRLGRATRPEIAEEILHEGGYNTPSFELLRHNTQKLAKLFGLGNGPPGPKPRFAAQTQKHAAVEKEMLRNKVQNAAQGTLVLALDKKGTPVKPDDKSVAVRIGPNLGWKYVTREDEDAGVTRKMVTLPYWDQDPERWNRGDRLGAPDQLARRQRKRTVYTTAKDEHGNPVYQPVSFDLGGAPRSPLRVVQVKETAAEKADRLDRQLKEGRIIPPEERIELRPYERPVWERHEVPYEVINERLVRPYGPSVSMNYHPPEAGPYTLPQRSSIHLHRPGWDYGQGPKEAASSLVDSHVHVRKGEKQRRGAKASDTLPPNISKEVFIPVKGVKEYSKEIPDEDSRTEIKFVRSVTGEMEEATPQEWAMAQAHNRAETQRMKASQDYKPQYIDITTVPQQKKIRVTYIDPSKLQLKSKEKDVVMFTSPNIRINPKLQKRLESYNLIGPETNSLQRLVEVPLGESKMRDRLLRPIEVHQEQELREATWVKAHAEEFVTAAAAAAAYKAQKLATQNLTAKAINDVWAAARKKSSKVSNWAEQNNATDLGGIISESALEPTIMKIEDLKRQVAHPTYGLSGDVLPGIHVEGLRDRQHLIKEPKRLAREVERKQFDLNKALKARNVIDVEQHRHSGLVGRWWKGQAKAAESVKAVDKFYAPTPTADSYLKDIGDFAQKVKDKAEEDPRVGVESAAYKAAQALKVQARELQHEHDRALFLGRRGGNLTHVGPSAGAHMPFDKVLASTIENHKKLLIGAGVVGAAVGTHYGYHKWQQHKLPESQRTAYYNKIIPGPIKFQHMPFVKPTGHYRIPSNTFTREFGFAGKKPAVQFGVGLHDKTLWKGSPEDRGYGKNAPIVKGLGGKVAPVGFSPSHLVHDPEYVFNQKRAFTPSGKQVVVKGHPLPLKVDIGKPVKVKLQRKNPNKLTTEDREKLIWAFKSKTVEERQKYLLDYFPPEDKIHDMIKDQKVINKINKQHGFKEPRRKYDEDSKVVSYTEEGDDRYSVINPLTRRLTEEDYWDSLVAKHGQGGQFDAPLVALRGKFKGKAAGEPFGYDPETGEPLYHSDVPAYYHYTEDLPVPGARTSRARRVNYVSRFDSTQNAVRGTGTRPKKANPAQVTLSHLEGSPIDYETRGARMTSQRVVAGRRTIKTDLVSTRPGGQPQKKPYNAGSVLGIDPHSQIGELRMTPEGQLTREIGPENRLVNMHVDDKYIYVPGVGEVFYDPEPTPYSRRKVLQAQQASPETAAKPMGRNPRGNVKHHMQQRPDRGRE